MNHLPALNIIKNNNGLEKETTHSELSNTFTLYESLVSPISLPKQSLNVDPLPIQFGTSDICTLQEMLELSSLLSDDDNEPDPFENSKDCSSSKPIRTNCTTKGIE